MPLRFRLIRLFRSIYILLIFLLVVWWRRHSIFFFPLSPKEKMTAASVSPTVATKTGTVAIYVPRSLLRRIDLLNAISDRENGDNSNESTAPLQFSVPASVAGVGSAALLSLYCQLGHRTMHEAMPRSAGEFHNSITSEEAEFLLQQLPLPTHMFEAFELLRLADFLQFRDLLVLVAGHVATHLAGRSTTDMRRALGLSAPDDDVAHLSPETRAAIELEKIWIDSS